MTITAPMSDSTAAGSGSPDLTLAEAREMIDRAVSKAREFTLSGAFAVVDAAGNVVSISRMEEAPASAPVVARAKAYLAAVMQGPTHTFSARMDEHPVRWMAYLKLLGQTGFPGGGGTPIMRGKRCVGGMATGPGVGAVTSIPGVHPDRLVSGNARGNAEDLVISHALRVPYRSQHGEGVH